jgi:hypothetical protein
MAGFRFIHISFDPCELASQVKKVEWLEVETSMAQDPRELVSRVNEVVELPETWAFNHST